MTDAGVRADDASGPGMVDWGLAVGTARRMAGSGPRLSPEETEQVIRIVVEQGQPYLGEEIQVMVTKVLQRDKGRMLFAQPQVR